MVAPEHAGALADLIVEQQTILTRLQKNRRNTPTGMAYHYTGQRGMEGITKNGTLWLSDYATMPDTGEISWAISVGMDVFRKAYEESARTGRLNRFFEMVTTIAKKPLKELFHAYILSMTPNGEVSGQWELYGEKSAGYCLCFDGKLLDKAFVAFTKSSGLLASGSFKVLYDENRLRRLMKLYVDNAFEAVLWLKVKNSYSSRRASFEVMYEIGANLLFAFIFTALFFKHPGDSAEDEYRYIVMTAPSSPRSPLLKWRPGRKGKIAYFDFEWKSHSPSPLKQVKIGPAQNEARGRRIVEKALKSAGLWADIAMSSMPLVKHT